MIRIARKNTNNASVTASSPAATVTAARYEGRLLAFVESRLGRRGPSEDIVQDSFIGFLNSLPNYDGRRPLESYLFSICAYKLTDHLRREGRRPAVPLSSASDSTGDWQISDSARRASSIARTLQTIRGLNNLGIPGLM
jgi:RNA polymerase sigma-70 factor (ECF subfamily)